MLFIAHFFGAVLWWLSHKYSKRFRREIIDPKIFSDGRVMKEVPDIREHRRPILEDPPDAN